MNVSFSVLNSYPLGASTSSTVYVPFESPVILFPLADDVIFFISLPFESLITNTAPITGLLVFLSNLKIDTTDVLAFF